MITSTVLGLGIGTEETKELASSCDELMFPGLHEEVILKNEIILHNPTVEQQHYAVAK